MSKVNKKIKPKVLAIDDKKENLVALETVLEDFECDLHFATSGKWWQEQEKRRGAYDKGVTEGCLPGRGRNLDRSTTIHRGH